MMTISLFGHHNTIGLPTGVGLYVLYVREGVDFWNSRRVWGLAKPCLSDFINVVSMVEIVDTLLNSVFGLSYHRVSRGL